MGGARRFMMVFFGIVASLILLRFFLGCIVVRPILFPAPQTAPKPVAPGGTLIEIQSDGRIARSFFMQAVSGSSAKLLLIFHGNGATMDGDVDLGRLFVAKGWNVLLIEYPGYGLSSDSSPSESKIYTDAEAMIRHVQKEKGIEVDQTAALAHSLGSAVAIEMGQRGLVSRMALFSPFTSTAEVGAFHFMPSGLKWLPYVIVCDRFNNIDKAESIDLPVFIVHGRYDSVIPFYMGERLAGTFTNSTFVAIDSDHNDVFYRLSNIEWIMLDDFLSSLPRSLD